MIIYFIFFLGGGGPLPQFFWPISVNLGQIRLHPEFCCPRPCGSALKVPGGWGVVVGNTNNHYHSSLSWVELTPYRVFVQFYTVKKEQINIYCDRKQELECQFNIYFDSPTVLFLQCILDLHYYKLFSFLMCLTKYFAQIITFWSSPSELDIGSWCQPPTHPTTHKLSKLDH